MFNLLTLPTLAATSPARPESAKTASSPKAAPGPKQGRSSSADPLTFHASPFTSLDDSVFEQMMQMHDPDNSLRVVHNDERGDGIPLHHFDRLGCQLIRSDQLRMS